MKTKRLPATGFVFAPPQGGSHPLSIAELKAWRLKEPVSGRRYTVVKLQSQSGAVGYGEGGPTTQAELIEARAAMAGRRAHETEFIRARFASMPAIEAAVGNAALDLASRSKQIPLYQYLGGPVRFKVRLLARLDATDEATTAGPLERAKKSGIRAFTMPVLQRDAMIPLQEYVDRARRRVAAIQSTGGAGSEWVLDGGPGLTPGDAAMLGVALEKTHLMWFDEPTAVATTDALAKFTDESVMPVGLGRRITDLSTFQNLLRFGSVNVLRPSLGLNSVAKIKRAAAIAETHYVAVAAYHEGGPIGSLAGIHLAAALTNAFSQDIPVPAADRDAAMRAEITSGNREGATGGYAELMNRPGLGIDVNERALDSFSEERV